LLRKRVFARPRPDSVYAPQGICLELRRSEGDLSALLPGRSGAGIDRDALGLSLVAAIAELLGLECAASDNLLFRCA